MRLRSLVLVPALVASLLLGVAAHAADQPSVAGTRWQYDQGRQTRRPSVVEFHADGTLRQVTELSTATGTWTQRGDALEYVIAGTTRFRVTLAGARMTGTWTRLRGTSAGQTAPSRASRLP